MKKLAVFVLIASLFAIATTVTKAHDSEDSPKPFIQKLQNVRQEFKEKSATREGERKEKMDDLRKSIVSNFFNIMLKRLQSAQDRLTKIMTRIETRVVKIKSEDPSKDLTKVDAEIASTKDDLLDNQAKIDTLKTDFDAMITSTSPRELFKNVKVDIKDVKDGLQNIRRSLSQIIGDIKGLHVGETKEASPKP